MSFTSSLIDDTMSYLICHFKSFDICNQFLINLLEDEKTKINLVDIILNDGNYKNKLVDYVRKIFKTPITFKVS